MSSLCAFPFCACLCAPLTSDFRLLTFFLLLPLRPRPTPRETGSLLTTDYGLRTTDYGLRTTDDRLLTSVFCVDQVGKLAGAAMNLDDASAFHFGQVGAAPTFVHAKARGSQ